MKNGITLIPVILLALLGGSVPCAAATKVWVGGGSNNRWANEGNFIPGAPVSGDDLVFGGELRKANQNNISNLKIQSITFTNGGFTIGPQTAANNLTLTNGLTVQSNVEGDNVYQLLTFASGPLGLTNHSTASTLRFEASATYTNLPRTVFSNQGFGLTFAGIGNFAFGVEAAIRGSGGLTKLGGGVLTLLASNTYSGPTTVGGGRLVMSTAHAGGGSISVQSGATLEAVIGAAGTTLRCSSLTLGNAPDGSVTNEFNLGTQGNPTAPVIYATNLTTVGTVVVNVKGSGVTTGQVALIRYHGAIGGAGFNFVLGSLPAGRSGYLTNSANSVDLVLSGVAPVTNRPPNFIVILADDLGYETIRANGGRSYPTPHLDRLAAEGVRFTHCYAQPNCTPSRVQIMTGMSNVRNYVDFGTLEPSQTTFGHLLRNAGYATCVAGKWQLGSRDPGLPRHFGFDESILWAHMGRGERYADPSLSINGGELQTFPGAYGPDLCQEFVLEFIRRNKDRPFFVYYPMILTHAPFEATPDSADWGGPTAKDDALKQQHFADMVAYLDKLVGRLDQELIRLGLRENTLILFTGDNGTAPGIRSEVEGGVIVQGGKGSTKLRGMRVPLIASWPGKIASGRVCTNLVDLTDFLPTLCEAAGIVPPATLTLDGRSFLPQLRGQPGHPRDWIYSFWVPLHEDQSDYLGNRGAVEQAFDQRYKLYSTGDFFDLLNDPEQEAPLRVADLTGEAAAAAEKLQAALDQFQPIHPAHLNSPVAHARTVGVVQNRPRPIRLTGTAPVGQPLTFGVTSLPTNGVLSGTAPDLIYTPATHYTGPDGFTFQTSNGQTNSAPALISITIWPDSDGDGVPDWWMERYFGHPTGQAADRSRANDDADEDGMTNLEEFLAGTIPTNALSNLRITSVMPETNGCRVSWTTVGGRSYVVQAGEPGGGSFTNISPSIPVWGVGDSVTHFFDDSSSIGEARRFYRIQSEGQP